MELVILKLVSGDVVIGRHDVENSPEGQRRILKPMNLMLDPMQGGVGMIPYDAIYTQEEPKEFTFNKEHIMHYMKVHSSFEEAFIKQVTGIETPKQEIIT